MTTIDELTGDGVRAAADELADVLHDCVAHGASVGFLPPFTHGDARAFWLDVARQVEGVAKRLRRTRAGTDEREVEDGERCHRSQMGSLRPAVEAAAGDEPCIRRVTFPA